MRVISGTCKGRRLIAPRGSRVRPALDKVKEAVFDILFDVSDLTVLDLFAGTGSMGIEALSRGAAQCTFVENNAAACKALHANVEACGLKDRAIAWRCTVASAIARLDARKAVFDLIFVDPPYGKDYVNATLKKLAVSSLVGDTTIVVIEHHPKEPIEPITGMTLTDTRKYGQTLISFMEKEPTNPTP